MGVDLQEDNDAAGVGGEFSAMAWEIAARGKSGREVARLHESWAARLLVCDAFDMVQQHLDQAVDAWAGYDEPTLVARTWCLKASCSGDAGDYAAAVASYKHAQQLAEEIGDAPLALCVVANRAICEIRRGDPKAAATQSRRAFVKAEAEGAAEMVLATHIIRASSYQMAGNFLAACNEHEAAAKLVAEGAVLPPEPALSLSMDTNHGISILRSGKPQRAVGLFERALDTAREKLGGNPPLTVARCMFHAGEARRQAREFAAARALLEESAAIAATEVETSGSGKGIRSRWSALAMEVANSQGLCAMQEGALRFNGELTAASGGTAPAATPPPSSTGSSASQGADLPAGGRRESLGAGEGLDSTVKQRRRRRRVKTAAEEAAIIIAKGGKAGEAGGHPVQKASSATLEGIAWSLAGRGNTKGAEALKRADHAVETLLAHEKRPTASEPANPSAPASEAIGESVPAGSESYGQLAKLQLGVLCSQGVAVRGGLGLGPGCTSGIARRAVAAGTGGAAGDAAGALAAVAAARVATKAANAGWAVAGQLVKKQLACAGQASVESARQLALAHAHAGAIDLMTGKTVEAAERFGRQLDEARKTGDALLEALAERNLADTREAHGDLPGTLRHLRRSRSLAQRGHSPALEADVCRRLSSVYAEIAGVASDPDRTSTNPEASAPEAAARGVSDVEEGEDQEEAPDGVLDNASCASLETEIEEKEDSDWDFLQSTAAARAQVFAERYEAAVSGLHWPVSGGSGGEGGSRGEGVEAAGGG